jgi:hypothetical protein
MLPEEPPELLIVPEERDDSFELLVVPEFLDVVGRLTEVFEPLLVEVGLFTLVPLFLVLTPELFSNLAPFIPLRTFEDPYDLLLELLLPLTVLPLALRIEP